MRWRPTLTAMVGVGLLAAGLVVPTSAGAATTTAAALPAIVPTRLAYPSGGNSVAGLGNDGANQNAQFTDSVPATVAPSWRNGPPLCPQSGGVGASSISVSRTLTIVAESQYQCASVSAYTIATGALVWRKQYHSVDEAIVSGGTVYVKRDDPATSQTMVDSLSARTGGRLWTGPVSTRGGNLSVGAGLVTNDDVVLSARTGGALWKPRVDVGRPGWSFVAGGRLFYASGMGATASDASGRGLWRTLYPKDLTGIWPNQSSARPSLHDGLVYVPGPKTIVLGAKTGRIVRTLPQSAQSIAFDGRTGFFTTYGDTSSPAKAATLRAVDLITGTVRWTHSFPMNSIFPWDAASAPLVANGLVWITSMSGSTDETTVLALDESTGVRRSEFVAPCADGGSGGNLAIAQHRLFVSTACGVQTYVPSKSIPVVTTPGEMLSDPGFERGKDGWAPMGNGSVDRTTTVTRNGKGAITVTPASSTAGTVGATRTVATDAQRHAWFRASCWVRPSTTGTSVAFRSREWAPSDPPTTPTTPIAPHSGWTGFDVRELTVGVWTRLDATGYVQEAGDSLAMQVFSMNAAAAGGTLTVDDCSVTGYQPSS